MSKSVQTVTRTREEITSAITQNAILVSGLGKLMFAALMHNAYTLEHVPVKDNPRHHIDQAEAEAVLQHYYSTIDNILADTEHLTII